MGGIRFHAAVLVVLTFLCGFVSYNAGLILGLHLANERWRYFVFYQDVDELC